MYLKRVQEIPLEKEGEEGIRILLPRKDATDLEVREVHFPKGMRGSLQEAIHSHSDEQQAYLILEGAGRLSVEGVETEVGKGSFIYIPKDVKHGMINTGKGELVYLLVNSWVK
jgi:quercetin dioxygenase-like cupin family protein